MKILQISDIHWRNIHDLADSYRDIREGMLQDLQNYCTHSDSTFDHIFICGDIAFSGTETEYNKANRFLKDLCEIVGCKPSEVFMVPGNHDKNVSAAPKSLREMVNIGLTHEDQNDNTINDWISNDLQSLKMMYNPFYQYNKFAIGYGSSEPLMHKLLDNSQTGVKYDEEHDTMYWEDELGNGLQGYRVMVYGVNTAFNSDLNDYDPGVRDNGHKLFLPKVAYKGGHKTDGRINILIAHHPLLFLTSSKALQTDLDDRYQLQLYGHVHIANSNMENNAVHVFSGSLQPDEYGGTADYCPVFNIIDMQVISNGLSGDNLQVNLQVHYWNSRRFEQDTKKSQMFNVKLTDNNRWREGKKMAQVSLPEGISKREVRIAFTQYPHAKNIIQELGEKLYHYDDNQSLYFNIMRFLEIVRQYNLWGELWTKINYYGGES